MKKILFIALALVVALAGLGIGYASWTDKVTVQGPVTTGKVCVQWDILEQSDECPHGPPWIVPVNVSDRNLDVYAITGHLNGWPLLGVQNAQPYRSGKDVACFEVTGVGENSAIVTVHNAYPLYYVDMEVEFCNCGTVPVRLTDIKVEALNFTLANQPWSDATHPSNGGEIWVKVTDGIGTQLETNECKAASVKFVVQQTAEQSRGELGNGDPYQFKITWTVVQWNEYD